MERKWENYAASSIYLSEVVSILVAMGIKPHGDYTVYLYFSQIANHVFEVHSIALYLIFRFQPLHADFFHGSSHTSLQYDHTFEMSCQCRNAGVNSSYTTTWRMKLNVERCYFVSDQALAARWWFEKRNVHNKSLGYPRRTREVGHQLLIAVCTCAYTQIHVRVHAVTRV